MNEVKLGVIGIGRIGSNHARIAKKLNNVNLVGYCDIVCEKVNSMSKKYEITPFYDYKEMLKHVDAVIISTQTEYHYEIAKYCIMNKKHVLVEKPITIEVNEAEELVELAKENHVVLCVGHVERFNSAYGELKNIFSLNETIGISIKRMSPMDHRVKDIDVILDLMVHDIDIVLNLMNGCEIKSISAMGSIVRVESSSLNHMDYAVAQLKFDNGIIVDLTASRVTEKKIRQIYINQADKFIEMDYMNKEVIVYRGFKANTDKTVNENVKYQEEAIVQKMSVNTTESLFMENQNFINAILGKEELIVTGEDGVKTLMVAKEIQAIIYGTNP